MKTTYNKLVRDRIPEIIAQDGKICAVKTLTQNQFAQALAQKLVEEANEACTADQEHQLSELADITEVIDALLITNGWQKSDLIRVQGQRRQTRGGFEKRLMLLYTEDPFASGGSPQKLAAYIQSIPALFENSAMETYDHMGALLTDAILQAGLNYETVVKPRVQKVMAIPEAQTTSGFLDVLKKTGAAQVLSWSHPEKPARLVAIAQFFQTEGIESAEQLRAWLQNDENIPRLKQQRGVGDKTADYFKILVGLSTTAIDRHIFTFLAEAGIETQDYKEAKALVHAAADILKVDYAVLDHNLWKYMSQREKEKRKR